jgi:glycosyltransferase involved in cell wall biosynthesis
MKKACIITGFRDGPGGVEVVNMYLHRVLESLGYEIDYCTADDVPGTLLNKLLHLVYSNCIFTYKKFSKNVNTYDLLIAVGEYNYGIPNKNCINIFHSSLWGGYLALKETIPLRNKLSLIRGHILEKKWSRGKYCIAVSDFIRDHLQQSGIQIDGVISNCINTDLFVPQEKNRSGYLNIGTYGYNGMRKGFDILRKISKNIGCKINTYNDFPQNTDIEDFIIHPTVRNNELPDEYNKYRILIFPSRYEAMQMVPLEAMACGCPVVISNVGLGPQLKKHIPEFVVDGFDEEAIGEYGRRIALIEANWQYFSKLAREYVVKNHSFNVFAEQWTDAILKVSI